MFRLLALSLLLIGCFSTTASAGYYRGYSYSYGNPVSHVGYLVPTPHGWRRVRPQVIRLPLVIHAWHR